VTSATSLDSWQSIDSSGLANSVRDKPFYPNTVRRMKRYFLIEKALDPLGFTAAQVTFRSLDP